MQTVRDVMSTDIQYCTPLDNIYEVAVKMREFDVGAIPIVDDGHLVGMITDRDLVVRGIAEKHPGSTAVTEVMSRDLVTLSPDDSVQKAADMMARHQIRRLPVVENGRLVGIVALGDLATNRYSDESAGRALSEISEQHSVH
ncbi:MULTISPECIES: CBS domain-containing protein [Geobacillus]|jgi:CBS domain-containing protein|uniref:Inosine-5'-monophosphate dehydrogenase related protein n=2 Tax=Geobacillus thermodenitrificans TaxID=33940 RepID=A4ILX9_GEOTN|nr:MULTISPECIES: CBS domain-containing protein [Geobacillus]ABO66333.1 Inosine-5'-monophosphate dehydrogenase related protein [Geobacillus thermodenitrificans NG80-2]ARA97272.1 CBS domain-containing protein [Geobacillus thermodenitrificans]ARP42089.1 CBS domain-containing protein YhcV [Geobacillus thermodenitrificans]ATO36568.1 CBS domain-containing protein [Geobacillus thermodenitrificans]MEC5188455.1 CBS domain-containing protein [Geobacillus thermodenitrificans]